MNVISIRTHDTTLLGLVASNYMFEAISMFVPFFVTIRTFEQRVYVVTHLYRY